MNMLDFRPDWEDLWNEDDFTHHTGDKIEFRGFGFYRSRAYLHNGIMQQDTMLVLPFAEKKHTVLVFNGRDPREAFKAIVGLPEYQG